MQREKTNEGWRWETPSALCAFAVTTLKAVTLQQICEECSNNFWMTAVGDGIVDSKDLMVLAEYGAILAGDVNYDGVVDFFDLAELAKNWLRQQP